MLGASASPAHRIGVLVSAKKPKPSSSEDVLARVSNLADDSSRKKFFAAHASLQEAKFVRTLIDTVVSQGRVETHRALGLAEAAVFLSGKLGDQEILALSLRAKANALYLGGQNRPALEFYEKSLELFDALKAEEEIARTLSASLQVLILLGDYDRAFAAADRAREIFTRLGETRRLARLDNNVGNIYHRQDRFEEALACYERCYQQLLSYGDSQELVTALSNMAVCLISLNDFPRALSTYERARAFCDANNMPLLRSQADYNIAYLYYLRGEYSRGIQMLQEARHQCEATGDNYHLALCHLDLSEIYLELNLSADAKDMAHEGSVRFQKLGMGYEEAKCMAYEAMAFSQLNKAVQSLDLFSQSRAIFVREKNLVWPWLIDLYQSVVLCNEGRLFEARRLCTRAATFFDTSFLPGKAALCQLLLARISVRTGDLAAARRECARALERVQSIDAPVLAYQAHFLMGQTEQLSGNLSQAYASFQKAREALETLRSSLHGEELKIAFMKNRLEVYESLVDLCLGDKDRADSAEESFSYMEMAKSRSLAELLVHHEQAAPSRESGQSGLVRRIRDMREELNWYYRRIELEQLRSEDPSPERIEKLQKQARDHENELLRALREVPQTNFAGPRGEVPGSGPAAVSVLESLRASLPPQTALVEYYVVKDQFVAAIATRDALEIVPVTPVSRVVNLLRLLHFQISKFRLGPEYVRSFEKQLMDATLSHLRELYAELIAPLRVHLNASHLVIVPHGVLHYLPFHALHDGEKYLIDSFTVSYAPSAAIFALCQQKPTLQSGSSLILGVPDAQAPQILDEVQAVAKILPGAELLIGPHASEQALREKGMHSRLIHIATHGNFRQDNPMFSGIRLGTNYFSLYDLYQLKIEAELVILSGCATGLNVVTAGDELLGLIRGLLYAGARSLLLTLWDVHDRSTSEFMSSFYSRLQDSQDNAVALQSAMKDLRSRYPHPYYWAPFTLIGKLSQS
jgi:CHAT domain-containing protein